MKTLFLLFACCLVTSASTLSGRYSLSYQPVNQPVPDWNRRFTLTNGAFTLTTLLFTGGTGSEGGCVPVQLYNFDTGRLYSDPCSFTPAGAFVDTLGPAMYSTGSIVLGSTTVLRWHEFSNQIQGQGSGTFSFSYSGPTMTLNPLNQDGDRPYTVTSNVPVTIRGSIDYRVNGVCVWCETFAGTGFLTGESASGGNPNLRTRGFVSIPFTAEPVPEPSTWAMIAGAAGFGIRLRRLRSSR